MYYQILRPISPHHMRKDAIDIIWLSASIKVSSQLVHSWEKDFFISSIILNALQCQLYSCDGITQVTTTIMEIPNVIIHLCNVLVHCHVISDNNTGKAAIQIQ